MTGALSAVGSVSASRSVRSGRFYCTSPVKDKITLSCMHDVVGSWIVGVVGFQVPVSI